jgi:UDP-2,3-diacylglucosamine pyrophosphatase LpxH
MNVSTRIAQVFDSAQVIEFDDRSKIVLMSDCHRGDGSWADDLLKNQNLYMTALNHYDKEDFTYIELGDGDELWENKRFSDIVHVHSDVLRLLFQFFDDGRLYLLYGNHDIVKKNPKFVKANLYCYYDERKRRIMPLFKNIQLHEGLILRHKTNGIKILLLHGHQADFLNDRLWKLSRFMVRYLWKPLQLIGVHDPTSASKNHDKKEAVESKMIDWVKTNHQILIAGHTHRPVFPKEGEPPYFNDGCCVHPQSITALEITNGCISLVSWGVKTREDGTLYVARERMEGPAKLQGYMDANLKCAKNDFVC